MHSQLVAVLGLSTRHAKKLRTPVESARRGGSVLSPFAASPALKKRVGYAWVSMEGSGQG